MNSPWSTPYLSLLTSTDKDVLQQIFVSLQAELVTLNRRVVELETAMKSNVSKEQARY